MDSTKISTWWNNRLHTWCLKLNFFGVKVFGKNRIFQSEGSSGVPLITVFMNFSNFSNLFSFSSTGRDELPIDIKWYLIPLLNILISAWKVQQQAFEGLNPGTACGPVLSVISVLSVEGENKSKLRVCSHFFFNYVHSSCEYSVCSPDIGSVKIMLPLTSLCFSQTQQKLSTFPAAPPLSAATIIPFKSQGIQKSVSCSWHQASAFWYIGPSFVPILSPFDLLPSPDRYRSHCRGIGAFR